MAEVRDLCGRSRTVSRKRTVGEDGCGTGNREFPSERQSKSEVESVVEESFEKVPEGETSTVGQ